jgi:hypothetical protein
MASPALGAAIPAPAINADLLRGAARTWNAELLHSPPKGNGASPAFRFAIR